MGNYFLWKRDFLAHHGIKGQKWGIRRYQNEDGSLTAEGRERYGVKNIDSKQLYKELYRKDASSLEGYKKIFKEQGDIVIDQSNKLTESRKDDYKNWYNSDKIVNDAINYLNPLFGGPKMVDDKEYLQSEVEDFLNGNAISDDDTYITAPMSEKSKKIYDDFDQAVSDYRSASKSFVNQLVGNMGNETLEYIDSRGFKSTYSDVVRRAIEDPVANYTIKNEDMVMEPYGIEGFDSEAKKAYNNALNKIMKAYT